VFCFLPRWCTESQEFVWLKTLRITYMWDEWVEDGMGCEMASGWVRVKSEKIN